MRVLGVVPARGGSKGVPRKNIADLNGAPLLVHTIAPALASGVLAHVIVSTEDAAIAEVARDAGAEVPFSRPTELATDSARSIHVIQHALEAMSATHGDYDAVMMLQPTCPFRRSDDIIAAVNLLESAAADSVISVVAVAGGHPARMKFMDREGFLVDPPFAEREENQNRQDLPPIYIRSGSIYLTRSRVILDGSFKGRRSAGLVLPELRSVNIDTPLDLEWARYLASSGQVTPNV